MALDTQSKQESETSQLSGLGIGKRLKPICALPRARFQKAKPNVPNLKRPGPNCAPRQIEKVSTETEKLEGHGKSNNIEKDANREKLHTEPQTYETESTATALTNENQSDVNKKIDGKSPTQQINVSKESYEKSFDNLRPTITSISRKEDTNISRNEESDISSEISKNFLKSIVTSPRKNTLLTNVKSKNNIDLIQNSSDSLEPTRTFDITDSEKVTAQSNKESDTAQDNIDVSQTSVSKATSHNVSKNASENENSATEEVTQKESPNEKSLPEQEATEDRNSATVNSTSDRASKHPLISSILSKKRAEPKKDVQHRRKRYRKGETAPERSKMTMADLIYYNPTSDLGMKHDSTNDTSVISNVVEQEDASQNPDESQGAADEEGDDEEASYSGPRLVIGEDGSISIDQSSLIVQRKAQPVIEKILRNEETTYASFRKHPLAKQWSDKDTYIFYKALSLVGTDFGLMEKMFPHRTRRELKMKFKREEKYNIDLINKAMYEPQLTFDAESLEKHIADVILERDDQENDQSAVNGNNPKRRRKKDADGDKAATVKTPKQKAEKKVKPNNKKKKGTDVLESENDTVQTENNPSENVEDEIQIDDKRVKQNKKRNKGDLDDSENCEDLTENEPPCEEDVVAEKRIKQKNKKRKRICVSESEEELDCIDDDPPYEAEVHDTKNLTPTKSKKNDVAKSPISLDKMNGSHSKTDEQMNGVEEVRSKRKRKAKKLPDCFIDADEIEDLDMLILNVAERSNSSCENENIDSENFEIIESADLNELNANIEDREAIEFTEEALKIHPLRAHIPENTDTILLKLNSEIVENIKQVDHIPDNIESVVLSSGNVKDTEEEENITERRVTEPPCETVTNTQVELVDLENEEACESQSVLNDHSKSGLTVVTPPRLFIKNTLVKPHDKNAKHNRESHSTSKVRTKSDRTVATLPRMPHKTKVAPPVSKRKKALKTTPIVNRKCNAATVERTENEIQILDNGVANEVVISEETDSKSKKVDSKVSKLPPKKRNIHGNESQTSKVSSLSYTPVEEDLTICSKNQLTPKNVHRTYSKTTMKTPISQNTLVTSLQTPMLTPEHSSLIFTSLNVSNSQLVAIPLTPESKESSNSMVIYAKSDSDDLYHMFMLQSPAT